MSSLQSRLQIGLALSLTLVMALLLVAGTSAVRQLVESFVATRLQHDAEGLLGTLSQGPDGDPTLSSQGLTPVYRQPFSGHYFVVRFADGQVLRSRSLWDQTLEVPVLAPGETRLLRLPGPSGQELLIWAGGYRKSNRLLTLAVGEDLTPLNQQIASYQWLFAVAAIAVVALLLALQRLVVRRTLRPLDHVRADIARLERGEVGRLPEKVPYEVLPLVREFNRVLDLLGKHLERSRNALGNLAHAIKGPLNLLMQGLDHEALRSQGELRDALAGQTERIRQLMERELRRARLAGAGTPGRRFQAAEEVPALIGSLRSLHRDRELDIRCDAMPTGTVDMDREDLLELLGNLLDNACKWARSEVRFAVEANADNLRIRVEDDGPGVSGQQLEQLSRRGVRTDESVQGHGLGLSIARDIVRLYGGGLAFERSPKLGGLRASATLQLHGGGGAS
jgi:signal transduction histidine kinase